MIPATLKHPLYLALAIHTYILPSEEDHFINLKFFYLPQNTRGEVRHHSCLSFLTTQDNWKTLRQTNYFYLVCKILCLWTLVFLRFEISWFPALEGKHHKGCRTETLITYKFYLIITCESLYNFIRKAEIFVMCKSPVFKIDDNSFLLFYYQTRNVNVTETVLINRSKLF